MSPIQFESKHDSNLVRIGPIIESQAIWGLIFSDPLWEHHPSFGLNFRFGPKFRSPLQMLLEQIMTDLGANILK